MEYSNLLFGTSELDKVYTDWYVNPDYFNVGNYV